MTIQVESKKNKEKHLTAITGDKNKKQKNKNTPSD
jgi:hypothetical protein